jgi:intein/homing endonuclease
MGFIADQVKREFDNRRVGIVEFSESSEFCGKPLYPRQRVLLKLLFLEEMEGWEEDIVTEWQEGTGELTLPPNTRERRDYLRENKFSHFSEIVLVGGRRSSKGFVTGLAVGKKIYDTWKLGDPGGHYGIDPQKEIYFSCIASSLDQAKKYQFADLISVITSCKSLTANKVQEESFSIPTASDMQYLLELKNRGIKVGRDFSKLRGIPLAANADSIRGSATLCTIFDEMAWMMEGESRSSAKACYDALKPSLAQFGKDAFVFCNSSPATKIGQFFKRWEDSFEMTEQGHPKFMTLLSVKFPSWELYKDYKIDPGRRFKSAIMVSPDADPETLNEDDRLACLAARDEETSNPESFKVERRGEWAEIQDSYLDPKSIDGSFSGIWSGGTVTANRSGGSYLFRYKCHLDPSSTTAGFGFALAHVEYEAETPHVVFDYIQRWDPKNFGGTIDWHHIIEESTIWIQLFHPEEFSFDQFNCLSKDTIIQTGYGGLKLSEIAADLEVGESKKVNIPVQSIDSVASISEIYYRGLADTIIFSTKMGYEIEATPEHRLYVKKAKPKPWHKNNDPTWIESSDIRVGDWIAVRKNGLASEEYVDLTRHHPDISPFRFERYPRVLDERLARVLGAMIAEGNVGSYFWAFSNNDREFIDDFTNCMSYSFGGSWGYKIITSDNKNWADQMVVRGGKDVGNLFNALGGMNNKSQDKFVPEVIFKSPKSVICNFLKSLFEGDGHVSVSRGNDEAVILTTTSEQLGKDAQLLLLQVGIFSTRKHENYFYKGDKRSKWHLKIMGPDILEFSKVVGFITDRKKKKLVTVCDQVKSRGDRAGIRRKNNVDGDLLWVRVSSIGESQDECYDISVPGPECFVANGIISHNSVAPLQTLRSKLGEMRLHIPKLRQVNATNKLNWNRWEVFKSAINRGLVHIPPDCPDSYYAMQELKFLQIKNGKVEKQDIGPVKTKDIADCICECVYYLLNTEEGFNANPLNMEPRFGARGGFGLNNENSDPLAQLSKLSQRSNARGNMMNPVRGMGHRLSRKRR